MTVRTKIGACRATDKQDRRLTTPCPAQRRSPTMLPAERAPRPAHRATLTVAMLVLACACDTESIGAPSPGSGASVAFSSVRPPSIEVTAINDVFDLPCGTFAIRASDTGWMRTTTFFDESGTPIKLQIQ